MHDYWSTDPLLGIVPVKPIDVIVVHVHHTIAALEMVDQVNN